LEDCRAAYERQDYAAAIQLCRPPAEQGDARAQLSLCGLYYYGQYYYGQGDRRGAATGARLEADDPIPMICMPSPPPPATPVGFEREPDDNGERLVWLEPHVLNQLRALPGPGESYSDMKLWRRGDEGAGPSCLSERISNSMMAQIIAVSTTKNRMVLMRSTLESVAG
jgi:hypothetical protein